MPACRTHPSVQQLGILVIGERLWAIGLMLADVEDRPALALKALGLGVETPV